MPREIKLSKLPLNRQSQVLAWAQMEDDGSPNCRVKAVYLDQFYNPVGGRWEALRFGYENWDFGLDHDQASYVVFL